MFKHIWLLRSGLALHSCKFYSLILVLSLLAACADLATPVPQVRPTGASVPPPTRTAQPSTIYPTFTTAPTAVFATATAARPAQSSEASFQPVTTSSLSPITAPASHTATSTAVPATTAVTTLALIPPAPQPAAPTPVITGPVLTPANLTRVIDGDTIEVAFAGSGRATVRLIGMDTPETKDPARPVECFGPEATAKTVELTGQAGQKVLLEKDVSEVDRYGRMLRYVWLDLPGGRLLLNEELVRWGFAQAATFPPDVKYQDRFVALTREAREARRGLWSVCSEFGAPAVPPAAAPPAKTSNPAAAPPAARSVTGDSTPCQQGQIKGNHNSGIYHLPGQQYYSVTRNSSVRCYDTEAQAQAAGLRRSKV